MPDWVTDATESIGAKLDNVEKLQAGDGRIDLYGFGNGDFAGDLRVGIALDIERRLTKEWALWGQGSVYYDNEEGDGWSVLTGLRYRW